MIPMVVYPAETTAQVKPPVLNEKSWYEEITLGESLVHVMMLLGIRLKIL